MCSSCQAVVINGILCHETSCPDEWKDRVLECWNCGTEFVPEFKGQKFCNESCLNEEIDDEEIEN